MNGAISIEKNENGRSVCVLTLPEKEDVYVLTLAMMDAGFDVLYEPRNRGAGCESCILCNEETCIKLVFAGTGEVQNEGKAGCTRFTIQ